MHCAALVPEHKLSVTLQSHGDLALEEQLSAAVLILQRDSAAVPVRDTPAAFRISTAHKINHSNADVSSPACPQNMLIRCAHVPECVWIH